MAMTDLNLSLFLEGSHEIDDHPQLEGIDLFKRPQRCPKNPDHKGFIPINKFSLQDLPSAYRKDDMFELVKCIAALTARIAVKYVSEDRPQSYPDNGAPFPFYDLRGMDLTRAGTGRVQYVRKFTENRDKNCPCNECTANNISRKVWGEIILYTARHVVFDAFEAIKSVCKLEYDTSDSAGIDLEVYYGDPGKVLEDRCRLMCATHDMDLVGRLTSTVERCDELFRKLFDGSALSRKQNRLAVIVSHPHGCSKHVSVGEWTHVLELGKSKTRYVYNNCTCPGSSGAPVYILGKECWKYDHVHSGSSTLGNFSASESDYLNSKFFL